MHSTIMENSTTLESLENVLQEEFVITLVTSTRRSGTLLASTPANQHKLLRRLSSSFSELLDPPETVRSVA